MFFLQELSIGRRSHGWVWLRNSNPGSVLWRSRKSYCVRCLHRIGAAVCILTYCTSNPAPWWWFGESSRRCPKGLGPTCFWETQKEFLASDFDLAVTAILGIKMTLAIFEIKDSLFLSPCSLSLQLLQKIYILKESQWVCVTVSRRKMLDRSLFPTGYICMVSLSFALWEQGRIHAWISRGTGQGWFDDVSSPSPNGNPMLADDTCFEVTLLLDRWLTLSV